MTYEKIKNWYKENKEKIVLGLCFVLVFFVGYGTGSFSRENQNIKPKLQNNYNTILKEKPAADPPATKSKEEVLGKTIPAKADEKCQIKGNVSSKGKRTYHIPGGAFYSLVKPEQCFNTEEEAVKAGFVKSSK